MKCPKCGTHSSKVVETRDNYRRRVCRNGHRFSTWEIEESVVNRFKELGGAVSEALRRLRERKDGKASYRN